MSSPVLPRDDFRRVAIVNRGEPAMRLIHAVREFNREHGTELRTIALYTEPDRQAMFVREADESVLLGPATFLDERDGHRKSGYLDYRRLEQALVAGRADAAWVGWGFVAEHAEFAELCLRLGINFIGPSPDTMRRLGDKITAKQLAEEAKIPVAAWSGGPIGSHEELTAHATRLGYPLMLKATAGGGGRGIRQVHGPDELVEAYERARAEALLAFGNDTVFLERKVSGARHIEVQIMGDRYDTIWALGVRDCTIQRRHQKVVEEAPSPVLSEGQDAELRAAAERLGHVARYVGAGTVEFLYDPKTQTFAFMEVNTRLQVEHPVTELTSGVDLVKLQLQVARGGRLQGAPPVPRGHAIEVRVCAEDPDHHFAPAPGHIELLRLPTGPGLRTDIGVAEGDDIPPEFDSMIAKMIAYGRDRDEALARLRRALAQSAIVIRGGTSNKAFLLALLDRSEVRNSEVDSTWLDELAARGEHVSRAHADVALLQAAVDAYDAETALELGQFLTSAARGRPRVKAQAVRVLELQYRGNSYRFNVRRISRAGYHVLPLDDEHEAGPIALEVERRGRFERRLTCIGQTHRVLSISFGVENLVEVEGVPHRISRDSGGMVRSPAPAVVMAIHVKPGDVVSAGDRLLALEAMKMELPVFAPLSGWVREVLVSGNVQVDAGAPLLVVVPHRAAGSERGGSEQVRFCRPAPSAAVAGPRERWRRAIDDVRCSLLGFDSDSSETRRLQRELLELRRAMSASAEDAEVVHAEDELLRTFIDLHALFRREPAGGGEEGEDEDGRKTEQYLFHYLRALDSHGEGLPAHFRQRLERALAHYGVSSLEHTRELDESLLCIYKSHERAEQQVPLILAVLEGRLEQRNALMGQVGSEFHALLDQLIRVSHGRFPAVNDLAREVRYQYFDLPLFEQARGEVLEQVDTTLTRLGSEADTEVRAGLIDWLVECPYPLVSVLGPRFDEAAPQARELMLEVMTRRYYRFRALETLGLGQSNGTDYATVAYVYEGRRIHVFTAFTPLERLFESAAALCQPIAEVPADQDVVLDFYVRSQVVQRDVEALQRELAALLNRVAFPRPMRRIVLVVEGPARGSIRYFTYRHSSEGYREELLYRGLHPMIGKRLHLWRLSNFSLERLPAATDDVFLFRAVAHSNIKDERLLALAEVRDVTPVRDAQGRVVQLPHLERMLTEALAAIRLAQARRSASDRLYWNRVFLYVWPPLEVPRSELGEIAHRLAPLTEGIGLEQVVVRARMPDPHTGELRDTVLRFSNASVQGGGLMLSYSDVPEQPLKPLEQYEQKVVQLRRRGLMYPYEIIKMLTPARDSAGSELPPGEFIEYDFNEGGTLAPISPPRPYGQNQAHIVVGVIRNFTARYPEGMTRVILLGDPAKEMGSLAEPECSRICAAIDLAEAMGVPLEWFALSAGAKISMKSGTENMDWVAKALRQIVEFTQRGGEINVVVCGINVGAQPYWNAEATMLMHTRGILIMQPETAMVLTGKQALDYSGSVSAEDNLGIGGYGRIMGPNGQAQYWAADMGEACQILLRHYDHCYRTRGEVMLRRTVTTDPVERDVRPYPHGGSEGSFTTVGDVFSLESNPERKKPFEIRKIMSAVIDQDHAPLERWRDMADAEIGVIWDAHIGGWPVCLIGLESYPVRRLGAVPADGPEQWTAGTLFPRSSKKVARSINAASGNRPLVVLANLSGFDGSPESMRSLQLEYGAEIGRAVVNFKGPIVFCVVSRYHGGAFVVFSKALNPNFESAAVEGAYASVIGGAPAAAVVFARDVETRAKKDARVVELEAAIAKAGPEEKMALRARLADVYAHVHSEKLGEVADEFDRIHSVERALKVGSLDHIIPAQGLRPYLVEAIERGLKKASGG